MFYKTNDNESLKLQCANMSINIKNKKELELKRRDTLLSCLKKIFNFVNEIQDVTDSKELCLMLENMKIALDANSNNVKMLNELQKELEIISNKLATNEVIDLDTFNESYNTNKSKIQENELLIEGFVCKYIDFCNFRDLVEKGDSTKENFQNGSSTSIDNATLKENSEHEEISAEHEKEECKTTEAESEQENKSDKKAEIKDNNILIISEIKNKVILPYTVAELEFILERNKDKYNNLKDVIEAEFTVPLSRYKNARIARFRETFNLMKYKSNAPLIKCLDLALELTWNNLLNPAVITACKNIDELDIYLDFLNTNELEKFKIFDVKYEIAPMKK